ALLREHLPSIGNRKLLRRNVALLIYTRRLASAAGAVISRPIASVNALQTVGIDGSERIVADVAIEIPALRVTGILIVEWLIGASKPPLRSREVSRPE